MALCKVLCPSSEFVKWRHWFAEVEPNEPTVEHQYLAQIAAEVRRSWVSPDTKLQVKDEDFLLVPASKAPTPQPVSEESAKLVPVVSLTTPEDRLAHSKLCWGALMAASTGSAEGIPTG